MNEHRQSLFRRSYGNTSCFCFHPVAQIPDRREMGCSLPSQMWPADTRGCFSRSAHMSTSCAWERRVSTHVHLPSPGAAGQDTHPRPIPGGSGSGHTSTSHPWGQQVRTHVHLPSLGERAHPAESCTELARKTWTQPLKDKATGPRSFTLSTNH